ncbi:MAG: hypothetical protein MJ078_07345, partial [Clostridia bacterium]|nr:hypothetical protein [Clostridia bacterium]
MNKKLHFISFITLAVCLAVAVFIYFDPFSLRRPYNPNQTIFACWDDSAPQDEKPQGTDPGLTLAKWDLSKAYNYPYNEDCTPEVFFQEWMDVEGLTEADLEARDCRQLVIVAAMDINNSRTKLTCYKKQNNGKWVAVDGLTALDGTLGKNGISHDRAEGDGTSPAGLWQIGTAFGNEDKPAGLKLPWREITQESVWIGSKGRYYNTWQEIDKIEDAQFSYSSGEHLIEYQQAYSLACVI